MAPKGAGIAIEKLMELGTQGSGEDLDSGVVLCHLGLLDLFQPALTLGGDDNVFHQNFLCFLGEPGGDVSLVVGVRPEMGGEPPS
jgi:hypothetical protein